jgi:hypothetical protein
MPGNWRIAVSELPAAYKADPEPERIPCEFHDRLVSGDSPAPDDPIDAATQQVDPGSSQETAVSIPPCRQAFSSAELCSDLILLCG